MWNGTVYKWQFDLIKDTSYLGISMVSIASIDEKTDHDKMTTQYVQCMWNLLDCHGSIITVTAKWAQLCLKSPTSRLFTEPFIQTQIKENIKAPRYWDRWIPRTKGQLRGNIFHLMTSSWITCFDRISDSRKACMCRDHSECGISQCENCNVVSHWLSPYSEWSLMCGTLLCVTRRH